MCAFLQIFQSVGFTAAVATVRQGAKSRRLQLDIETITSLRWWTVLSSKIILMLMLHIRK
jgi:hypothetical protein